MVTDMRITDKIFLLKSFSIGKDVWEDLDKELKKTGYPNGIQSINKSEMVERLLEEFTEELKKDNDEDNQEDKTT